LQLHSSADVQEVAYQQAVAAVKAAKEKQMAGQAVAADSSGCQG
jgi:hypothetical protein